MRDTDLVASLVAGEADGLAAAYDRYADPLYSYCRTIVPDPADAADAVQDTFVLAASRIGSLRDPEKFRSWLYAIARHECLRVLRARKRASAVGEVPEVTDAGADVSEDAERAEQVALVQQALGGLNPGEREVIDLQFRHELDAGEIASALGVSRNHVHSLMSRARAQLAAALAVLLVGRAGRDDCPELGQLLSDWDGHLTVLLRKRVHRHIEHCGTCTSRRAALLTPAAILEPFAAGLTLAIVAAPAGLRGEVLRLGLGQEAAAVARRAAAAQRAGSLGKHGFPKPARGVNGAVRHGRWRPSPRGQVAIAAGVVVSVAAASVTLALAGGAGHHGRLPAALPGPQHTPSSQHTPAPDTSAPQATPTARQRAAGPGAPPAHHPATPALLVQPAPAPGMATAPPAPARSPSQSPAPPLATSSPPQATPSPPATRTPTPAPTATLAPGTLSVTPGGGLLAVGGTAGGTITLRAAGGPVSWSITAAGLIRGTVTISPQSGTLLPGQSVKVTITGSVLATGDVLTVSPCGARFILLG